MSLLEQATATLADAVAREDLVAAAHALHTREALIAAGHVPTAAVLAQGEVIRRSLEALQQRWVRESARLSQVHVLGLGPEMDQVER